MPSTFLGRAADAGRLRSMVAACALVTVTGPGGVGKTRLVREGLRPEGPDLEPVEPLVCQLARLRSGADVDAVTAEVGFASPEAVAAGLAGSGAVLVLDNCEHVLDGVALFVSRLLQHDGGVRVVATSREPLGVDDEQVLVLAPLAVPRGDADLEANPAVRLFLDRASAAGAAWDAGPATLSAIGELCRRLDGLPLAIELAAARARALSPGELLGHMGRRLDLLEARRRGGDDLDRHRSLRAAVDVSIELLDDDERAAFDALGVFGGDFDLDQAHAVVAGEGRDRLATADVLARLVDRSLVVAQPTPDGTCYRLLETLRERAVEGLVRSGRDAEVAERFVQVTLDRADRIVAGGLEQWSGELLHRAATAFHDVVSAVRWCLDHDDGPERALRLLLPLFVAVHQSRPREVLALGREVFARWPDGSAPWRAEALSVVATAAVMAGEQAAAVELGEAALAAPSTLGAPPFLARRALGLAARRAGDLDAALVHFGEGRTAAAASGAASFERELAGFEASTLGLTGDDVAAVERLGRVVEEATSRGDGLAESWGRLLRVGVAMTAGRWEEAEADLARARAVTEALPDPDWWQGSILQASATIAAHGPGGWPSSVDGWRRAVEAAARRASVGELATTLRLAAAVAARLGHRPTAEGLLDAVPTSDELPMLPELFASDRRPLEAARPASRRPPDLATALRRARAVLATPADEPMPGDRAAPGSVADTRHEGARTGVLSPRGDVWFVEFAGRSTSVRHLKGLTDLAALLASPGEELHCLQLMGGAQVGGEAGPVLDDTARSAYQRRIRELQSEIDEAQDHGNAGLAARAEEELDALVGQLTEAFGLSGRRRATGSTTERARSAVTYRVRAAIRRLAEVHPVLGRHLDNAVRTGTWCAYRPEGDVTWDVAPG